MSSPDWGLLWSLWRVCLGPSYPFLLGFFLIYLVCRSHSAIWGFLSEGVVLFVAVDLTCLWEEAF